jgi:hypothetical protein
MASVWNSAVARCNIPSPSNTQIIIIARLRRVPKKGGVVDVMQFELSSTTTNQKTLKINHTRNYTTIPFRRLQENVMTHLRIPSGNHQRAIAFMLSDLPMLSVRTTDANMINFTTTNTAVLPSVLRSHMQQLPGVFTGSFTILQHQMVRYVSRFASKDTFSALDPAEIDSLLSRILSTLSEDGWYLNCGGRRIPLLKASGDSLRALAERKLLRHGRRRDQDAWDDLLHARSDTSSGSESGSSSSSDSDT